MALRVRSPYERPKKNYLVYVITFIFVVAIVFGGFYLYSKTLGSNGNEKVDSIEDTEKEVKKTKGNTDTVMAEIEAYLSNQKGVYGYSVIELDDGRSFGMRDADKYTAASSIKVAMAAYLYSQMDKGAIDPNTLLTYKSSDYEGGTGSLLADPIGSKYKVSYLLERMIVASDNVATNIITRTYGRTTMQNYIVLSGLNGIDIPNNNVTPKGMADLLSKIYNGKLISEKYEKILFDHMKNSITPTRLVAGVPKNIEAAHKIGSWDGAMSDVAVVFARNRAYAIAVYTEGVSWGEETDAVIAEISKKVYIFESSF